MRARHRQLADQARRVEAGHPVGLAVWIARARRNCGEQAQHDRGPHRASMREPVRRYNRDMPARVLVVDKTSATRDSIADALGDRAEVVHATREQAIAQLRAAAGANQGFEVVLLDGDPPPGPTLVRELAAAGAGAR